MQSRSANGPPPSKIGQFPATGKGDLFGGFRNSYVATLVERHSRYVMLIKVANKI